MSNEKVLLRLKTARGQIDAVIKMIEEDRYCIDISNQIMATQAILKRANKEIIGAHMQHCVHDAIGSQDADQKIEEMMDVINQLMK